MRIGTIVSWAVRAAGVLGALNIRGPSDPAAKRQLQDLITWDDRSIFIRGERVIVFAGEFHPFRLPVPSLWLDAMQKIKALGMNTVSIYIDWALLEGKQGQYRADGVFALEPFFEAASKAGLYVIARPGPYINAEVSGGGFPGWLTRINGTLRTKDRAFLEASDIYMANVCKAIAKAQITNGGPVILFQPENEYSSTTGATKPFPDGEYVQYVIDQARAAGVVVPMINNDQSHSGNLVPKKGPGSPDIYGHDAYFWGPDDCERPDFWRNADFGWGTKHMNISPTTPYSVVEFQGGSWMSWGGPGYDKCAQLMNADFMSIFYKTTFGMGAKLLGSYMTVGGANWGNLGNDGGISSYDYAASVREDRRVDRSKYSEIKLVANFIRASEGALALAVPDNATASAAIGPGGQPLDVSRLSVPGPTADGQARTQFFVVRHRDITVAASTSYTLSVRSSRGAAGAISIPRQGGSLTLQGRDAKIHVVDYDAGGVEIAYCTADILTWKKQPGGRVLLIVYGGVGEHHEIGVVESSLTKGNDTGNQSESTPPPRGNTLISDGIVSFSWEVNEGEKREMIRLGSLDVMLLDRAQARTFWVVDVANYANSTGKAAAPTDGAVIIKGGYLIRSASLDGGVLHVYGDFDHTATLELMGVPPQATSLSINGNATSFTADPTTGFWKTTVLYWKPAFTLPDINSPSHEWRYIDTLPELHPGYDDSKWRRADLTKTPNIKFPITTPVSLHAADYGFHSGYFAGVGWFMTKFTLDMPLGYDVPLYVVFSNSSGSGTGGSGSVPGGNYYRVHLYVNGWQFGRYISHLGPQDAFHVPEGILDYHGENWVGISLFALQPGGAKLAGIALTTAPGTAGPGGSGVIMTAYRNVTLVESPPWKQRAGAY
ncbi:hypothetical protein MAPG_08796 [Magnaporthiopsis poae ATCC 64411]|uniref:Beta-galactosidase n=1 Tax=Magnaporthiopsis poae (strain ATCC 64411 / 73-15) TaxID=644358 RepID=A0A0C4E899_MAGP6|nr:hypothetical protein MAPG_08796 [Magnaporthiopsis poae ATCC 64411]